MTKRQLILSAVLSTVLLSACSAKIEGGSGDAQPAATEEPFTHKIKGPDVEGQWSSDCVKEREDQYRQRKASFKENNILRSDIIYYDSSCTAIKQKYVTVGTYRWANVTNYGGYVVDYRFDLGNGVTQITGEEILIQGNLMYLSGFSVGYGNIDKTLPMAKIN